jgi:hypothetical protein
VNRSFGSCSVVTMPRRKPRAFSAHPRSAVGGNFDFKHLENILKGLNAKTEDDQGQDEDRAENSRGTRQVLRARSGTSRAMRVCCAIRGEATRRHRWNAAHGMATLGRDGVAAGYGEGEKWLTSTLTFLSSPRV